MEITIGHSNHTSYVNFLVQKCMFEHKYDMDWKQSKVHTYWDKSIFTYVQPSLLQAIKREAQDLSNILHASSIQKALFAWVPHMGSIKKNSSLHKTNSNRSTKSLKSSSI